MSDSFDADLNGIVILRRNALPSIDDLRFSDVYFGDPDDEVVAVESANDAVPAHVYLIRFFRTCSVAPGGRSRSPPGGTTPHPAGRGHRRLAPPLPRPRPETCSSQANRSRRRAAPTVTRLRSPPRWYRNRPRRSGRRDRARAFAPTPHGPLAWSGILWRRSEVLLPTFETYKCIAPQHKFACIDKNLF